MKLGKLLLEISAKIDNTKAPTKPSNNKYWHAGFREAYEQCVQIIKEYKNE